MFPLRFRTLILASAVALCATVNSAQAQQPDAGKGAAKTDAPKTTASDTLERGRYIVEDLAQCWRCHSPVDQRGVRDRNNWLHGGQVGMRPTVPVGEWAIVAPRLAGSPPGNDAQFIHLMMTGVSRTGRFLRQPMPQFRMKQEDAEAVLAYLKSLGGK